jgi:hypothetical protein
METLNIYVKDCSNCPGGMELQLFELLSPVWSGERVRLPFGEGEQRRIYTVIGWTDLFLGSPCEVKIARVRHRDSNAVGYLVWGGNCGVRILDRSARPTPGLDDHLPRGHGRPIIWVEDAADLPQQVQKRLASNGEEG